MLHQKTRRFAALMATVLCTALVLSLAAPAFAASPTGKGYGAESPAAQSNSKSKSVETAAAVKAPKLDRHALAFTGFNLVLIAGAGLLLLGAGFAIRASTGRRES